MDRKSEAQINHVQGEDPQLVKDRIAKGLRMDLNMVLSLVHMILSEPTVFNAVVDVFYDKWTEPHSDGKEETND